MTCLAHRLTPFVFVSAKAVNARHSLCRNRQTAYHVVMCPHYGFGIMKSRLQLEHFLMIVTSRQSAVQGCPEGMLHDGEISRAQSFGHPPAIQGLNVFRVRLKAFI